MAARSHKEDERPLALELPALPAEAQCRCCLVGLEAGRTWTYTDSAARAAAESTPPLVVRLPAPPESLVADDAPEGLPDREAEALLEALAIDEASSSSPDGEAGADALLSSSGDMPADDAAREDEEGDREDSSSASRRRWSF